MKALLDCCTRTPDGCLIFNGPAITQFSIRRTLYPAARIMWAETYGFSSASLKELESKMVIHIGECPNTGEERGGVRLPLCIEPTHLRLGDQHDAQRNAKDRR